MNIHRAAIAAALLAAVVPGSALAKKKAAAPAPAPAASDALGHLTTRTAGEFQRASSADRGGEIVLPANEAITLAELTGPGVIDRLWIAVEGADSFWRDIVVRVTWDGAVAPSVEAPIGDFFAVGPGARQDLQSLPMQVSSEGRSFTSFWKMPFAGAAKIELVNEGRSPTRQLMWEVEWRKVPALPEGSLYFHARYAQANPAEKGRPLSVLRTAGAGQWVGLTLSAQLGEPGAWGNGLIHVDVDGSKRKGPGETPILNWFGNLFGVDTDQGSFQGATLDEGTRVKARSSVYRFLVQDPVPFDKSIEVQLDHGVGNERADRLATVAYWYQDTPAVPSGELAAARDRHWDSPSADELAAWERADELNQAVIDAYRTQDLDKAFELLKELVVLEPDLVYANYNLACLHALRGDVDEALHLLEQAIELGFEQLSFARQDPDLASLREHERFRKLVGLE
jgi:hypothetical protein